MPSQIECDDCELTLLAFEARGPKPIGRDDCPRCGGSDFSFRG